MEENEKTSPTPGFEDQAEESPETTPESQPEQSLEEIAKAYNMTPAQVIKSYGEAQKKITKTSQELSQFRNKYQWADQFAHEINNRKGLREHIESFFESDRTSVPSEVKQAIDPVYQDVAQMKTYMHSMQMNSALDGLARDGYPIDAAIREKVFERVAESGNPDVEAHYFKIMGPDFFSKSRSEMRRDAARDKNKDAYVQNRGGAPNSKAADIKSMPKSEWSDALDSEISSMFRRTE